jgi:two-component system NtrC family response regulator
MTGRAARILAIDDEKSVCVTCKKILQEVDHHVDFVFSAREGLAKAIEGDYDVVLLDLKMPDASGMDVLDALRAQRPDVTVIIITGYATIQTSIEAIKKGAFDYVPKPFTPEELQMAVARALEDRRLRTENDFLKQELSRLGRDSRLIGRSRVMEEIVNQIRKIAPTDFTVTIYGESGSGKELVARAIHEHSDRRERPFVAVDISALTPTLVESELFGHVKGAFTGATQSRPGYFALAHTGTLFLDEISNVSLELQGKLLRALESRRIRPVGGEREQDVDARIVTATNRDLYELVEQGKFREDLYYRLNVIPMTVPPLRERSEDVPLLAVHFLGEATGRAGSAIKGFSTEAMAKLVSFPWPGNVRQLRNIVERLVATVEEDVIRAEHLPVEVRGNYPTVADLGVAEEPITADDLKEAKRRVKERVYAQVEKDFVWKALERAGWNVTRAAETVGMQRPNFHALMRKYGIRARGEEGR